MAHNARPLTPSPAPRDVSDGLPPSAGGSDPLTPDDLKRVAAERAAALVRDGMRIGLGTGSTAAHFVAALGERVRGGLAVVAVPTSEATRRQAEGEGIPLTTLDETPELDLTIDGADEIDGALRLIKGGGGALLHEKIVAAASRRMIVIADGSKRVERLGRFPLPVEVVFFGLARHPPRRRSRLCAERMSRARRASGAAPTATPSGPTAATPSSTRRSARSRARGARRGPGGDPRRRRARAVPRPCQRRYSRYGGWA